MFRDIYLIIGILAFLIVVLFLIRAFSVKELDDVSPGINCSPDLLTKADVLWVVPEFGNFSISNSQEWCEYIKSLNKTLGLHGVYHSYNEFGSDREKNYLNVGISDFENCFGYKPKMFKAPQLNLTEDDEKLILSNEMVILGRFSQLIHKVYHCSDTGRFSNRFVDWF